MKKLLFLLLFAGLGKLHALEQTQVLSMPPVRMSSTTLNLINYSTNTQNATTVNATASGETVLLSSPTAGNSHYVKKIMIMNAGSANVTVSLKKGSSGTTFFKGEVPSGGGATVFVKGGTGERIGTITQLIGNLSAAGDVDFSIMEYATEP